MSFFLPTNNTKSRLVTQGKLYLSLSATVRPDSTNNGLGTANPDSATDYIELTNWANSRIAAGEINVLPSVPAYDDDAAAGTAGLTAGQIYQTTGSGSAPLNEAGILMVKQ